MFSEHLLKKVITGGLLLSSFAASAIAEIQINLYSDTDCSGIYWGVP
jgi:hypothetical protein